MSYNLWKLFSEAKFEGAIELLQVLSTPLALLLLPEELVAAHVSLPVALVVWWSCQDRFLQDILHWKNVQIFLGAFKNLSVTHLAAFVQIQCDVSNMPN